MPKQEINYNNTIIYKIVCNDLNIKDAYIGHTTHFINRKDKHRKCCVYNMKSHLTIYDTINKNGGWYNWEMIEIEKFPCNDGNEARARERYHYEHHNSTLNMRNPNRTAKQWCEDNKERLQIKKQIPKLTLLAVSVVIECRMISAPATAPNICIPTNNIYFSSVFGVLIKKWKQN
jgi:hypothetical protein